MQRLDTSYRTRSSSGSRRPSRRSSCSHASASGSERAAARASTTPTGSTLALCERVTGHLRDLLVDYGLEVSSPGPQRPLTEARPLPALPRPPRARAHAQAARRPRSFTGELVGATRRGGHRRGRRRRRLDPVLGDQPQQPAGGRAMTKEIVEAVGVLEREKGISADKLMEALEDALLSAYKKTPGRRQVRARGDGPRHRRLPRLRADPAAGARGAAARRGRGGGRRAAGRPRDGRAARARGARDRPGAAGCSTAIRSTSATSRRTTSAASPPRPPSR